MTKGSDYILLLDDKFKQRNKVIINNIQGYEPNQINRKNLEGLVH